MTLRSLLARPYRLLLKDIVKIFGLLPSRARLGVIAVGLLMLGQAAMELITINGIRQLALVTSRPEGLAQEIPWRWIFGGFPGFASWAAASPERYLLLSAFFVALLVGLKNAIIWLTMWRTGQVSERMSRDVALEIMRRYLFGSYRWHLSSEGEATLQMMLWRSHLSTLLMQQLSALTGFFACAALFTGLIVQEPFISLFSVLLMGGCGLALYAGLRRRTDRCAAAAAQANRDENNTVLAATRGIRDVLLYSQQNSFLNTLRRVLDQALGARIFITLVPAVPSLVLEALGFLTIPLAILAMAALGMGMESMLSAVMLLVLTAWRVLPYLNRAVGQLVTIRSLRPMAMPVLDYLFSLRGREIEEPAEEAPPASFRESLELREASFRYPDAAEPALRDVSLIIPKGSQVGIIGQSGSGKSTLCYLLSGLCSPDSGGFYVDGAQLAPAQTPAFRRLVGFVPQTPFLLAGPLAANVAFSQWGRPWDEGRVREACSLAALDFIPLTPEGLLHPIGENGAGLSGGQVQRVSIARALYPCPEVLIFDEATSALDAGNENLIVSAIERLRGNVTSIIIAHRLSTIAHCDIIYWLDRGRLVAWGPPDEILPRYSASFEGASA